MFISIIFMIDFYQLIYYMYYAMNSLIIILLCYQLYPYYVFSCISLVNIQIEWHLPSCMKL